MTGLSDLYDDFLTRTLDFSKWTTTYTDVSTVPTGGLNIPLPATVNSYGIIRSVAAASLDNAAAYIRVDAVPTPANGNTIFMVQNAANDQDWVGWVYDNGTLYAQNRTGGVTTSLWSTPYSADHHWWRLRAAGGVTYWESSRDGLVWGVRASSTRATLTNAYVLLQAGHYTASPAPIGTFTIGTFNTLQAINRGVGYYATDFNQTALGNVLQGKNYDGLWTIDDGGQPSSVQIVPFTGGRALSMHAPAEQQNWVRTDQRAPIANLDLSLDVQFISTQHVQRTDAGCGTTSGSKTVTDTHITAGDVGKPVAGPGIPANATIASVTAGTSFVLSVAATATASGVSLTIDRPATDGETPQIIWRQVDVNNYYVIKIFTDYLMVSSVVGGVNTNLRYIGWGTQLGVTYHYRVIHVGSEMVIYRDTGDEASTGLVPRTYEIARVTDTGITAAGDIGMRAFKSAATFDNLEITEGKLPPSERHTFPVRQRTWGAYTADGTGDIPTESGLLQALGTKVGKRFEMASWFFDQGSTFPLAGAQALTAAGYQNVCSWGPEGWSFADILAGVHDTDIDALGTNIAAVGGTFWLRLMAEMNGSWHGYSYKFDPVLNGVSPSIGCSVQSYAQFQQVWIYIVGRIRALAPKTKFVFCVDETDEPRDNMWEFYYPGDGYVDALAFDAYNWGDSVNHSFSWQTHTEAFRDIYARMAGFSATLPIWVGETGAKEPLEDDGKVAGAVVPGRSPIDATHSKGTWVHDLMGETGFSRITTVLWFSVWKERDWRMDSSTDALTAFQTEFAKAPMVQAGGGFDPINVPLPIPFGYVDSKPTGRIEYLKLTEEGYADLVIEPSYGGVWLADFDFGAPSVRSVTEDRVQISGARDYTRLHSAKAITLNLQIVPYLGASVPYLVDTISRWMLPRRRPTLVYKPQGEDERQIKLRPSQFARPIVVNQAQMATMNIQFVAYEGIEVSTPVQAVQVPVGQTVEVVNFGTADALPVIRLNGDLVNPVIYNDTLDSVDAGARLGIAGEITASSFIELDVAARTAQLNGRPDAAAARRSQLSERRWFPLAPFSNFLRLVADSGTGWAEVRFSDSWL